MRHLIERLGSKLILMDVAAKLDGAQISGLEENERLRLSCCLFKVTVDHGQGIVLLVDNGCISSALALQRPCFEAFVRGLWLRACAADCNVKRAYKDNFPPTKQIIQELEELFPSGKLEDIKQANWVRWCSYTHGGKEQIVGQYSETGIDSNHDPVVIKQALYDAVLWQLFAAIELASAAGNMSLVQHFQSLISEL